MTWTQFHDMHSGGRLKLDWGQIFIEANNEAEAREKFVELFDRSPGHVTCECCGEDYSVSTAETLEQATGYERGCAHDVDGSYLERGDPKKSSYQTYIPLAEYEKDPKVKIIRVEAKP